MKSKKCVKCDFVCAETADVCKGCGTFFSSAPGNSIAAKSSSWSNSATASAYGMGKKSKSVAQMSLAAAFAAIVWSRLHERIGLLSDFLAVVLLVVGLVLAIVALLKSRRNPLSYGGKGFALSALAASGVLVMLYAMAIPSLIIKKKVPSAAWRQYESEEGKFTVRMPGEPRHTMQYLESKAGQVPMHLYEVDLGLRGACISGYTDLSGFSIAASDDSLLDAAAEGAEQFGEMTIISKKEISLHGYKGREVLLQPSAIKYGKDTFAVGRIYFVPPRLYLNIIAGPNSSELNQEKLKYLDSFRPLSTPLIDAAERGQLTLIASLWLETTDQKEREIAFVRAARKGRKETLRYLHDADVSINATDDLGRTALMMTAAYSTPVDQRVESCAVFLIGRGANLDVQDNDRQWTALMWSIVEGEGNATLALIKAGADLNLKARNGETALTYAKRLNNQLILEALQKAGAHE